MANPLNDKELLALFRENKERGFQRIVLKFQERVYWQIRRIAKTHQDSEDIMQNVFLKVWKGLDKFREDSNLYTWIYRIAFNETHTYLAKATKQRTVDLDPPVFENSIAINGNSYSGEEIESFLHKALGELPEKQKLVFELKYFEELKFQEISDLTGTSVGGLKASYHLAVKKIEEFLKNT